LSNTRVIRYPAIAARRLKGGYFRKYTYVTSYAAKMNRRRRYKQERKANWREAFRGLMDKLNIEARQGADQPNPKTHEITKWSFFADVAVVLGVVLGTPPSPFVLNQSRPMAK
jgi:hypothetical protein